MDDIAENGTLVGSVVYEPTVWQGSPTGGYVRTVLRRAGKSGGIAAAINGSGVIVGHLDDAPAMWSGPDAEPTLLPSPAPAGESAAVTDINDAGVMVGGWSRKTFEPWSRALRWTSASAQPEVLAMVGTTSATAQATACNNAGEAVGYSQVDSDVPGRGNQTATWWDPPVR